MVHIPATWTCKINCFDLGDIRPRRCRLPLGSLSHPDAVQLFRWIVLAPLTARIAQNAKPLLAILHAPAAHSLTFSRRISKTLPLSAGSAESPILFAVCVSPALDLLSGL